MTNITRHEVTGITPLQALFITALLAVSGSSERARCTATELFEHGAVGAVWGFLARHTTARISWLRLVSINHEATSRFLFSWPTASTLTIESMMRTLEACTSAAASRVGGTVRTTSAHHPLGVLALLNHDERLQLLRCVQGALTPRNLCVLQATVESERVGTSVPRATDADVRSAIAHLESRLLGACMYTLGAPEEISRRLLAA